VYFYYRMCSLPIECVLNGTKAMWILFGAVLGMERGACRMCPLTVECVLSYCRMCSLLRSNVSADCGDMGGEYASVYTCIECVLFP